MQDLLAGNQPKIEGSTMTNETTASQPKSIGDDAQFLQLLTAVETAPRYSKELSEASAALIIAIDSKLRAPAAHASATIQAAPEMTDAQIDDAICMVYATDYQDDSAAYDRAIVRAALASLAATIQEPVMVAEPVTHELMQHLGTMRAVFHTNMLRAYPEKSHAEIAAEIDRALGAAPMVADPAGVAAGANLYRKTALVSAEQFLPAEGKIPDGVISDGMGDPRKDSSYTFVLDTKEGRHVMRAGDYVCTGVEGEKWNVEQSIFEKTYELAATVKAVPSEALDWAEVLEKAALAAEATDVAQWSDHAGWHDDGAQTRSDIADAIRALAAPLADKTGASGEKA